MKEKKLKKNFGKVKKKVSLTNSLYTKKAWCSGCKKLKTIDKFNKHKKRITQRFCKLCQKNFSYRYYRTNKHKIMPSIKKSKRIRTQLNHLFVTRYKLENPCVDCLKEKVINVDIQDLTFDHIRDKSYDISYLVVKGYPINTIKKELEKCEVVCWGHHMLRESNKRKDFVITLSKKLSKYRTIKTKKNYLNKEITRLSKRVRRKEYAESL